MAMEHDLASRDGFGESARSSVSPVALPGFLAPLVFTWLLLLFLPACAPRQVVLDPNLPTTPATPETSDVPRLWVFSVGISAYADQSLSLRFAERDAQSVDDFFSSPAGGSVPSERRKLLLGRAATSSSLLAELTAFLRRSDPDDMMIVFLSMHGFATSSDAFHLLAYDTALRGDGLGFDLSTALPDTALKEIFASTAARRILLILDTCHAGSALSLGSKGAPLPRLKGLNVEQAHIVLGRPNLAILASSGEREDSIELSNVQHGLFTHHLLRGLGGSADGYGRPAMDNVVTLSELFDFTRAGVVCDSEDRQHPAMKGDANIPLIRTSAHALTPPSTCRQNTQMLEPSPFRSDDRSPAAISFEEGTIWVKEGNWTRATESFMRSMQERALPETTFNTGVCAREAGKYALAWGLFRSITRPAGPQHPQLRARAAAHQDEVRNILASPRASISPEHASLSIDGYAVDDVSELGDGSLLAPGIRPKGTGTPLLSSTPTLLLDPVRLHRFLLERPGYDSQVFEFSFLPGKHESIDMKITEQDPARLLKIGAVSFVLGGVTLGVTGVVDKALANRYRASTADWIPVPLYAVGGAAAATGAGLMIYHFVTRRK